MYEQDDNTSLKDPETWLSVYFSTATTAQSKRVAVLLTSRLKLKFRNTDWTLAGWVNDSFCPLFFYWSTSIHEEQALKAHDACVDSRVRARARVCVCVCVCV